MRTSGSAAMPPAVAKDGVQRRSAVEPMWIAVDTIGSMANGCTLQAALRIEAPGRADELDRRGRRRAGPGIERRDVQQIAGGTPHGQLRDGVLL
jgi:hypothetical protein